MKALIVLGLVLGGATPRVAPAQPAAVLASFAPPTAAPLARDSSYQTTVRRARSALEARRWADAAVLWREALLLDALAADHWNEYGRALYSDGQYREAVAAFERAIQLAGTDPATGSWNVARAYGHLGNGTQAYRWLAMALRLGFRMDGNLFEEPAFGRYGDEPRFRKLIEPGSTRPVRTRSRGQAGGREL